MKTNRSNDNDAPLRTLLTEWKADAPLPPRFQENVWRRIERAEVSPAPTVSLATVFAHWVANMLPRPALAVAYLTVLLLLGATVGWRVARIETARVTNQLSQRYAQVVDPYQTDPWR